MAGTSMPFDHLERASRVATLVAFAIAVFFAFGAPVLAVQWRLNPFPGFMLDPTMVVNERSAENWSGRMLGMAPPQVVTRVANVWVREPADVRAALAGRQAGERVPIFTRLPDGTVRLYPDVELTEFAGRDFASMFWLPYLVGLAYLAIGVWVYLASGSTRPGRALAFFCVCVALAAGLLFDVLTSHSASAIWIIAVALLGGSLVSLSLRFPVEWGPVSQRPWLLALPYLVSIGLATWGLYARTQTADPWLYLSARRTAYFYTAFACLAFLVVMYYRARASSRADIRRRARLVLLGSFLAFVPIVIWFLAPLTGRQLPFNSALFLPGLLIFPLSVATAILRYRMLELDSLVTRAIVYGLLTAILAGGISALIGLSQRLFVAFTGERSDVAIVVTTLIVASAINPIRALIQGWVDRQFREVPSLRLRSFGDEVVSFMQLTDPDLLGARFVDETAKALGAETGALVRIVDGRQVVQHTFGDWRGQAVVSVPIEHQNRRYGLLMLGPKRLGRNYQRSEVDSLSVVSTQVAQAMYVAQANLTGLKLAPAD